MSSSPLRWFLLNILAPYLILWFIVFLPTSNVLASTAVSTLVFSLMLPFPVFSYYRGKMRAIHPSLQFSHVQFCPLCGKGIERNRFTEGLLLIPFGFKTLRHYENAHAELAANARRARLSLTAFVDFVIVFLGALAAFSNVTRGIALGVSTLELFAAFLLPFAVVELFLLAALRYILISKKGAIFGA
jgi:hypothetical protein